MRDSVSSESPRPPYSPELLADLHADALPAATADEIWPRARADADATAVLAALDATAAELRSLAGPVEPMPDLVAARLRRVLLAEGPAAAETGRADPARAVPIITAQRSRTRSRLAMAAAAAAVAIGLGAFFGLENFGTTTPGPGDPLPSAMEPSATAGQIEVSGGVVPRTAALAVRGAEVIGRLADPKLRSDCLSANGYAASTALLGSGPAKVGERIGTLLLIPGDRPPLVIALVVGDRCSATNADLLAVNTVTD